METFFFLLCAAVAVFASLMVILQKNPVAAVLFLVLTFFAMAALFIQLSAPLIAALQVIIYVGAILVLFLFVLMLLNIRRLEEGGSLPLKVSGVLVAGMFLLIAAALVRSIALPADSGFLRPTAGLGSVENIGKSLFTTYLLPFEIASFLLLAGIIGAVVLARKKP